MEKVKIPDGGGVDTVTLLRYPDQKHLVVPVMENLGGFDKQGIQTLPLREDDVMLCCYPRSGTHWVWEMIRRILAGNAVIDKFDKDIGMLELLHSYKKFTEYASPRVLNTHLWFTQLPAEVTQKKTKIVLLYRNPKDVCVSYYVLHRDIPSYNYKGEFGNWLKLFLEGTLDWGGYGEYLKEWERILAEHPDHPVYIVSYDNITKNPVAELSKLSKFLGKDHEDSFLQTVLDACTIDKMRALKGEEWKKWDAANSPNAIYRKGKAGGWKEWFTVAQSEEFDRQWATLPGN